MGQEYLETFSLTSNGARIFGVLKPNKQWGSIIFGNVSLTNMRQVYFFTLIPISKGIRRQEKEGKTVLKLPDELV